jgi:molybdenum cofactor cytidylyltransferase
MTLQHAAIVLAAGASTRLGRAKQLLEIEGEPALRRVARYALSTDPCDCVVVLGHDSSRVEAALDGLPVRTLRITDAEALTGMAASLRAGVAALDQRAAGALIVLTDQPALTAEHLHALCTAWRMSPTLAVASEYAGVLGVPALLPRSWFGEIAALCGDVGARALLRTRRAEVIAIAAPELVRDIDTPEDIT